MTRRGFIEQEARALAAFYYRGIGAEAERTVMWIGRSYRCQCGYQTTSAGEIWDHGQTCQTGQLELALEVA